MKRISGFYFVGLMRGLALLMILSGILHAQAPAIPVLETAVYEDLKKLYSEILLVADGKPTSSIVASEQYKFAADLLQEAIKRSTGVVVPVISDTTVKAPFSQNLIILGNRSTSRISNELYDHHYSLMDLKYPGLGGYSVRSLHDPYGNGYGALLVGGSDVPGVTLGARALVAHLKTLPAVHGNLKLGWTMLTRLGENVVIPADLRQFETWEASKGYGSVGYFGWNSISKRMAMYYMTGDPFHAREALRLSFPDSEALKEIDEIDGERIENKHDPLAGPYHYNAMMLILYWDLIEESPVFSNVERLEITNAFARRFTHEGTPPFDKETYMINRVPQAVGSRHGQWSALSTYTLARYFNKYYPSAMWAQAESAGRIYFSSLHEHAWVIGEGDQLNWYATGIAPILIYMTLTGDRKPLENGVLQKLLAGQEVLMSGLVPDWSLNSAALSYFTQAAYLTGDGRWMNYLWRTEVDTDIFRLGQSFWPDERIKAVVPEDRVGKWLIHPIFEPMWRHQRSGFTLEQSFQNMSYRSAADASGDFILLDGYNGAYRNPYHTFDILELRLNGATLLKGYHNQVLTSADGMVEPKVAMGAALVHHGVVGKLTTAVAQVPNLPYVDWRRSLVLRKGRYALIVDDLEFRSDSDNMLSETTWEMPGAIWNPLHQMMQVNSAANPSVSYELHPSELMNVRKERITTMSWRGQARKESHKLFFYLLGENTTGDLSALCALRLSDRAAALTLPEAALAAVGKHEKIEGELVILSEKNLYGHAVREAGLSKSLLTASAPIDMDWDFEEGRMMVVNDQPVILSIAIASPDKIMVDGKRITGIAKADMYTFELPAGSHALNGATLSVDVQRILSTELQDVLQHARSLRREALAKNEQGRPAKTPILKPVMKANVGGSPVNSVTIPTSQGTLLGLASANTVTILNTAGHKVLEVSTPGEIRVLHWWKEAGLLMVGCADEKVMAFDINGNKKWEFTSEMDPAVYEAGKPYWFKAAYPGIAGLHSGIFDNGKSRAFVGSACTLEILDEDGKLVERMPVFWGNPRQFLMIDAADGSKNLLIGRWQSDRPNLAVVNSEKLELTGYGYVQVPEGHTFVNGWMAMNRYDNFHVDIDGDGQREIISAINGTWNRVSIYDEKGTPLYNAQFGPGLSSPRSTMRAMDVGDLTGDGKPEIIVGVASGVVSVLDGQAQKVWAKVLDSPPVVLKLVKEKRSTWICVGSEDGTVVAMDAHGNIIKQGKVNGRPVDLQLLETPKGWLSVITTETGEVSGFRLR